MADITFLGSAPLASKYGSYVYDPLPNGNSQTSATPRAPVNRRSDCQGLTSCRRRGNGWRASATGLEAATKHVFGRKYSSLTQHQATPVVPGRVYMVPVIPLGDLMRNRITLLTPILRGWVRHEDGP